MPNEKWKAGNDWIDTRDGQSYATVKIGSQVWMAENLKATTYTDGTEIPLLEDSLFWDAMNSSYKAYCYYNNSTSNRDTYGNLYTWRAAMNETDGSNSNPSGIQDACPVGWHIPSQEEYLELVDSLGGWMVAGGALKEAGTTH